LQWVWCFFDFVEKTPDLTSMRSVREPGSLTLPQVNHLEGAEAQRGREAERSTELSVFICVHLW
jgi:hypothetical protein